MTHAKIAPEFTDCQFINQFVKRIPIIFNDNGTLLHDERNTIKSFLVNNPEVPFQKIVVKKFRNRNIFQRVSYSFFRDSKAIRAYHNAAELRKKKISTPREIACIEEYANGLLKSSYVITEFTEGCPIKDFFIGTEEFDKVVAKEFAHFVVELHGKGILHHDLNSTNVLYHRSPQGNYFSVIDINRMKIKSSKNELTPYECFENLTRFTGSMDLFEYVLQHYIQYREWNKKMIDRAIKIKETHDKQWIRRKKFFSNLKKICHV